jgi:8-hydroxy-5-deazaflavin:NADPH oxidoreductase
MKPKIAIIGKGHVGGALQRGLEHAAYEVKSVGKDPARVRELAAWGEIVILAVPFPVLDDAIREMGENVNGKTVIDTTNALTPEHKLAFDNTTSSAEELQKKMPSAKVVKAFNTVFAEHMATGKADGTSLSLFVAGDDQGAKDKVLSLGRDIGFDAIDAGPLMNARWIETMGYFNIQLGYTLKMGTKIGFKLVH